jgi:Leucine Rich repeat
MGCTKRPVIFLIVAFLLLGSLGGCVRRTPHQRLKWKAEDFFTDKGAIALCKAIEKKDLAEIDRLAKSGVNVNAKGRGDMTPLLWAFPMGEEVFKKMLDLGADPNVKLTQSPWPFPLYYSVTSACAKPAFVEGLIHRQYFPSVQMGNYLKLALQHGGNPNIQDENGETPIFYLGGDSRGALVHLKRLSQLQTLWLGNNQVADAGLVYLRGLRQLRYLDFFHSDVTDAGLEHLKGLTQLQRLDLRETKVTDQGVKKLQQALPKCRIER